jgi:hypothetical protein
MQAPFVGTEPRNREFDGMKKRKWWKEQQPLSARKRKPYRPRKHLRKHHMPLYLMGDWQVIKYPDLEGAQPSYPEGGQIDTVGAAIYTMQKADTADSGYAVDDWGNGRIPFVVSSDLGRIIYGDPGTHHFPIWEWATENGIHLEEEVLNGFILPQMDKGNPKGYYFLANQWQCESTEGWDDVVQCFRDNFGSYPVYAKYEAKSPQDYPPDGEGAYNGGMVRIAAGTHS